MPKSKGVKKCIFSNRLNYSGYKLLLFLFYVAILIIGCEEGSIPGSFIRTSPNDFNGDGIEDMLVGAPNSTNGSAYAFFGSKSLATSISASNANVTLTGEGAEDQFGYSVTAGDIAASDQLGFSVN